MPTTYDEECDELPARTPTDAGQRRARSLAHELGLGVWSKAGRDAIGSFYRERPQLLGVPVRWRMRAGAADVDDGRATLEADLSRTGFAAPVVVGAWPLALLLGSTPLEK